VRCPLYAILRIVAALLFAVFPLVFGSKLSALDAKYVLPFAFLAAAVAGTEVLYDRDEAAKDKQKLKEAENELRVVSHRLDRQRERGLSMARLMQVMIPPTVKLEKLRDVIEELKRQGKANAMEIDGFLHKGLEVSNEVIREILKAVAIEVRAYWDAEADSVKSNIMLAYKTKGCPSDLFERLRRITKFIGAGRELENYNYVLELTMWGVPDPEIPALAVPVDNAANQDLKKQLIPGAPMAFALDADQAVPDTKNILSLAASELASNVQQELTEYFKGKKVRSFACLVLREKEQPFGILNIQSTFPDVLGRENKDAETIIKSIEQYRYCLEQLIGGQRRLQAAAS
jgi:hypothetical protein